LSPKIIISPFCKGRDQNACKIPLENLLPEITAGIPFAKPGYRDGVILVPVKPEHFKGQIVTLQDGDRLEGTFSRRQENEEPRKQIRVIHNSFWHPMRDIQPDPLVAVDAVLYHKGVLAEENENSDTTADYEVITFLTKISEEDQPMPPDTLLHNHFSWEGNGGTKTKMTAIEFEAAIKKSFLFWHNKTIMP